MRTVTLGSVRYKVRVVKDAQRHRRERGIATPDKLYGYIDPERKDIVVEKSDPKTMSTTMLHEMLHELLPFVDEDVIRSVEDRLFPVLWRHGFRPF